MDDLVKAIFGRRGSCAIGVKGLSYGILAVASEPGISRVCCLHFQNDVSSAPLLERPDQVITVFDFNILIMPPIRAAPLFG
jgi:hypothetical protein